jgi:hypothetical protein
LTFFLRAGVLARLYVEPSPFLLSPERAFALNPVGHLSFLGLTILLIWLMVRLGIQGWRQGAVFGLKLGALTWGALVVGLLSISTASLALLIGWFLGQTIELGVAGSGFKGVRLGRLFLQVLALVIGAFAITILLQTLGLAPAAIR